MDAAEPDITEIDSLCMNCYKQGNTKLLLTKIPHFRDVIVSSFDCEHCGTSNRSLQSAGTYCEKGIRYELLVQHSQDWNRQIVRSEHATITIPELEFEIPSSTSGGTLTTVEGVVDKAVTDLSDHVKLLEEHNNKYQNSSNEACATQPTKPLTDFINKLSNLKKQNHPFHLILDDPSGNSFIENPYFPQRDGAVTVSHYTRSPDQDAVLGVVDSMEQADEAVSSGQVGKDEVMIFEGFCPKCHEPCETNMKLVDIPHFKEVILMCTSCESCGLRDSEVKGGAAAEPKGIRTQLVLSSSRDLTRDILKSETCSLSIPELELDLEPGTLGGKFTTLEGILSDMKEQLQNTLPFITGDSSDVQRRAKLAQIISKLELITSGQLFDVTLVLDDPAGNSYLENPYAPDVDPNMQVATYERSAEQNEELGLTQKTDLGNF